MSAHKKLRVVLDTNVLISALGFQGAVKKAWSLAEEEKFDLFLSPFILQELEKNLVKKADFSIEEARLLI
jgi:predicted nucleic acid-binding protein